MDQDNGENFDYQQKLHDLVSNACRDEKVGIISIKNILMNEVAYCQNLLYNHITIEKTIDVWIDNFKNNLPHLLSSKADFHLKRTDRKILVIGAGPTARECDFDKLRNSDAVIICTNKSLRLLIEHDICPDVLVVLHSTPEIKGTINTEAVSRYVERFGRIKSEIIMPTTLDPDVFREIDEISERAHHNWFNPSIPGEQIENIDQFIERITRLPVIDTGGDAGTLALLMATELTDNAIGMIGMEHCLRLSDKWSNEQSFGFHIEYAPECNQIYAIPNSFKITLNSILSICRTKGMGRIYNLSNFGPLYARKLVPYMTLEDFLCLR